MLEELTMLIMSCDKFSDLWGGHIKMLEKHWGNRRIKTVIVTDKKTEQQFDNISILAVEEKEWSDRLKYALERTETDYVLITLDDYYLKKNVSEAEMEKMLSILRDDGYDYIRFFKYPQCSRKLKNLKYGKNFFDIDTKERYSVNLFPGLWRKDFLMKTLDKTRNIWQYEISLSVTATQEGAKCIATDDRYFKITDIVRQGKIQKKAKSFLEKNNISPESRETHSLLSEIKYYIKLWGKRYTPKWFFEIMRALAIKLGIRVLSAEER